MPLTEAQTAIIKATVPILETGGEALTKHFYGIMLKEYPEVVPFFNKAHQSSGDQPRALANAVLMYAKNIERLDKLGPLVGQIINKHVSLNINLEHYSVVGACLLRAIREVLGPEVATDAVIDAWGAAYGQLASILTTAEQGIYDAKAAAPGGWRGDREFTVKEKVAESAEITSFHLYPADGKPVLAYEAGQYIGLHIFVNGDETRRNYSISCASNGTYYRISVKREPGGVVSNHLHDHVNVGDKLNLYPPAGDFTLAASAKPLVLLCGGVGITPCIAMLEETLRSASDRPVHFIHAAKTKEVQAFSSYLTGLAKKHPNLHYHSHFSHAMDPATGNIVPKDFVSTKTLKQWLPADAAGSEVYFLGPLPFMVTMKGQLKDLGVAESSLHWEFFGPNKALLQK